MRPKSENVLKVINNFKTVLPFARRESALNMAKCSVWACNTSHCHGGWYSVATTSVFKLLIPRRDAFLDGVKKMSEDLGFKTPYHSGGQLTDDALVPWASINPDIWGNIYGSSMFNSILAFYHPEKRPDGARNLADIIDHWYDVYQRIKALEVAEEQASIKYPDITKELATLPVDERVDQKIKETITH